MKIGGLYFISLFAITATICSCSNERTIDIIDESSPNIEITVASNPCAVQTRITSGGIGVCYGLIGFEEDSQKALYDNLTIPQSTISLNSAAWKKASTRFTVYTPYSEEVSYLDENGLFMIPFDMEESGQTPQMSKSFIVEKKNGTQSILTSTDKLSSTISLTINGGGYINKVKAHWISAKGFYVYDSNTGNGHWENQKKHKDITFQIDDSSNNEIRFEAIPEKLTAKHTISLFTEDNEEMEISLEELIGEKELLPGGNYNAAINISKEDFGPTIEFSPTVSDWDKLSTHTIN